MPRWNHLFGKSIRLGAPVSSRVTRSRSCGVKLAGTEGVVDLVDTKRCKIVVQGVSIPKADGTEMPRPVDPSNVQITKLNLKNDPERADRVGGNR